MAKKKKNKNKKKFLKNLEEITIGTIAGVLSGIATSLIIKLLKW
ncbi:hypothetical protein [Pseudobutyrivibrio sp.]|nr:hypothetical protein [Pseudobutyrivibrio sp.]